MDKNEFWVKKMYWFYWARRRVEGSCRVNVAGQKKFRLKELIVGLCEKSDRMASHSLRDNRRVNINMKFLLCVFAFVTVAAAALEGLPPCPDTYGLATYLHPDFCDKFYKCENGTLTLETCENGLLFDGKGAVHNHCNYNWAVNCDKRLNDIIPISSPGCAYQFGLYPKGPGCHTTYVKCAYGVAYETPCEAGLAYDDKTHSCNWPDLLLDQCNPEEVVGFRCPDKVEPDTLAYKFWPYPRFATGDCGSLITCVNGYPRLIKCEHGKVVNELSLTCEDFEVVPKCAAYYGRK